MSELRKKVLSSQHHTYRSEWSYAKNGRSIQVGSSSQSSTSSIDKQSAKSTKVERRLLQFLTEFRSGSMTNKHGVDEILRIYKKYGRISETDGVESGSASSDMVSKSYSQSKNKPETKSKPKKSNVVSNAEEKRTNAVRKELERLADSTGFVSSYPSRLKRKSVPVKLFDMELFEKKQNTTRQSSRSKIANSRATITKQVQNTSIIEATSNTANAMTNVSQTSKTTSTLGISICISNPIQQSFQRKSTTQRTTTVTSVGNTTSVTGNCSSVFENPKANFTHSKGRTIHHIPMIMVKEEGTS